MSGHTKIWSQFSDPTSGSMVKNLSATQKPQVQSLGWEDPLEKGHGDLLILLPGKSHRQRSLLGYSPWVSRVRHHWVTKKQQSNSRALTFNHTWPVNYHICKSYLGLRIPTTVHMPIDKWELKGKHIWNHLSFLEDITVSKEFETLWNWTESTERNWTMSLIYKIETYFTLFQK